MAFVCNSLGCSAQGGALKNHHFTLNFTLYLGDSQLMLTNCFNTFKFIYTSAIVHLIHAEVQILLRC